MAGTISFGGLASGLDTENLISELMQIERIPLTRLETEKTELEGKRTAWQGLNTQLVSLSSTLLSLKASSTWGGKTATSGDTAVFTATAGSSAASGQYSVEVVDIARAHRVASTAHTGALNLSGTFQVNGKDVTVALTDGLSEVRDKINEADAGVTASVVDNKLVLTSKTLGTGGSITLTDDPVTEVLKGTGLLQADGSANTIQAATDAVIRVDGLEVSHSTNTITDVIQGVTLNLKKAGSGAVSLEVGEDTQGIVTKIQSFVEQYNKVMESIADLSRTGTPGRWGEETEDSGGILKGDPTLMRIQQNLKRITTNRVLGSDGEYSSLVQVGISTSDSASDTGYDAAGRLTIDTEELTAALKEDLAGVKALFYDDINVAGSSLGAGAISSGTSGGYDVSSIINGVTSSLDWGSGEGWMDNTAGDFTDDWVEISFSGAKRLEKIILHTLDSTSYPADQYGIKDYELQYWTGSAWANLATVTGNTEGTMTHVIPTTETDKIRVKINGSNDGQQSRLVEVEDHIHNGVVSELDSYVQSLVKSGSGMIDAKMDGLDDTIDDVSDRIERMEARVEAKEDYYDRVFAAMESYLSDLQQQSSWLTSMLGSLNGSSSDS